MNKPEDESISNDFEYVLAKLMTEYAIQGRNHIPKINGNASDLKKELIRCEKEKQKNYVKYLEEASIERNSSFGPGKQVICAVKQGSVVETFANILETGYKISEEHQKKLRIKIDYSKPSSWDKKHMAWQAAAQVISSEEKKFNITHIRKTILSPILSASY